MELPTLLDAAVIAAAGVLALLGVRHGFARLTVAWPMRWLIPALGAYAAGRVAEFALLVAWELAALSSIVGPPVSWVAFAVGFVAALVPLLMFMDNLIARVAVWTSSRRSGAGERALGGLFGLAVGLALSAIAIGHSPLRREGADEPAWVRGSLLLPYFRGAFKTAERVAEMTWPHVAATRRWSR
jgi:uncharacterized membrane protein required for colicin V production